MPVIDHWWQTETGWAIAANCLGVERLPVVAGSPTRPVPGWDLRVLGRDGREVPAGRSGALVVKLPMPPGASPTLWNAEERFREVYLSTFPGYYETGDAGYIDRDGYPFVMARTDDVINVAGHRLSTGAIEEVLAAHPAVAECAVIGAADPIKGQSPVGLLVLKAGVDRPHSEIVTEAIQMVRDQIGPVAAFKAAAVVTGLPKQRGRGRFYERPCATSPTTTSTRYPPPSTTPSSSSRSARRCRPWATSFRLCPLAVPSDGGRGHLLFGCPMAFVPGCGDVRARSRKTTVVMTCTEPAFRSALAKGGDVRFACSSTIAIT